MTEAPAPEKSQRLPSPERPDASTAPSNAPGTMNTLQTLGNRRLGRDNKPIPTEGEHEPRASPPSGGENDTHGDDGEAHPSDESEADQTLKLADIRTRFEARTSARLTRDRTRRDYWKTFEKFVVCEGLLKFSKKRLAGPEGAELLIRHYSHLSDGSRPYQMSGIKKCWTRGLDLVWPLTKDDLPKPPRPRRGVSPRRELVAPWIQAARETTDLYERSWFLVELNGGLRPIDQQAELRVEDLAYNAAGDIIGIYAESARHSFKRDADVRQSLPGEVAQAIKAWLVQHPAPGPKAFIWPRRTRQHGIQAARMMDESSLSRMRKRFARHHGLQWVSSKDLRHFVSATLQDSGMPTVERRYYLGHTPNLADMDQRYADRHPDETFEVQRRHLPQGVLGTFLQWREREKAIPAEVADIFWRAVKDDMDPDDAKRAFYEAIRSARKEAKMEFATSLVP